MSSYGTPFGRPVEHRGGGSTSGSSIFSVLYGSCVPFPPDEVRRLYGDLAMYLARFEEAARAAEKAGVAAAGTSRRSSTRLASVPDAPARPAPIHRGLAAKTRLPTARVCRLRPLTGRAGVVPRPGRVLSGGLFGRVEVGRWCRVTVRSVHAR